jgi:hypothetical protein
MLKTLQVKNLQQPGGVVVKHSGLWTRRQEFESLPGYQPLLESVLLAICCTQFCFINYILD